MHTTNRRLRYFSLFLALLALGPSPACSAGDGGAEVPDTGIEAFVGDWRYASGSVVTRCPGSAEVSVATTGEATSVLLGTRSDLSMPMEDGCSLNLDIEGDTASLTAPVSCTVAAGGVVATVTIQTYSLTTDDGQTAIESGTGNTVVQSGTQTVRCTAVISGILERL